MPTTWMPPIDQGWVAFFGHFKRHKGWAVVIALVNLVGIAYGFYYYRAQFAATPWWLWPFVPDSPLAVLWAELALLAYWLRRPSAILDALAIVGNVQVGLWTCYVLLAYEPSFHTLDFLQGEGPIDLNTILWVGHLGMAVLALVFVEGLRERARTTALLGIGAAALYYLVNDALDYVPFFATGRCGIRPHSVPCEAASEPLLAIVTTGLTLLAVGGLGWATFRAASTAGRK